jgi:hypothetical protein
MLQTFFNCYKFLLNKCIYESMFSLACGGYKTERTDRAQSGGGRESGCGTDVGDAHTAVANKIILCYFVK